MCTSLSRQLACIALAGTFAACGGDGLTIPRDNGPAALKALSGNGQEGTVGSRLQRPLVVELTDASSNPLPGVSIFFRFQSDVPGAQVDPETLTDAEGRASTDVKLGETTGAHRVEAQLAPASASTLRATFDLTAVAEKGKKDKDGKGGDGGGGSDDDDDAEEEDD